MKYLAFLLMLVVVSTPVIPRAHAEDDEELSLGDEEKKTKSEIEALEADGAKVERESKEGRARVEKIKGEIQALKDLRDEKNKKLLEMAAARDSALLEIKELEIQRKQAEAELNRAKEDEKEFHEKSKTTAAELGQKKAALQVEIDNMKKEKASINRSLASPQMPTETAAVSARPSMESDLTLTKDCRFYESPTKSPKIIGTKSVGSSVHKVAEGNNWIAFPVSTTQKGYMLKSCFTP